MGVGVRVLVGRRVAVGRGVRMELGVAATAVFVANGVRDGRSATMGAAGAGVERP